MSSGFISETEIAEARRQRQEEWDKVRTEDQPKEAPEETYDSRPLFQRLEEQRLKKEAEYEETHRLKNMIKGLDDDEVGFLELVEKTKATAARQISLEEQQEMKEFRERVNHLQETAEQQRIRAQLAAPTRPAPPSKSNLQGIIVRKRKASDSNEQVKAISPKLNGTSAASEHTENSKPLVISDGPGALKCIGVLPGLGHYEDSSSENSSSDSDEHSSHCEERLDLLGRRQAEKKKDDEGTKT